MKNEMTIAEGLAESGRIINQQEGRIATLSANVYRLEAQLEEVRAASLESLQADNEKLRQALLSIASISGGLHPHYGPPAEERLHDINEIAAPFIAK